MTTPLCILLVDDSPFFLNLERNFLRHIPATLVEARSAEAALAMARRYRPSLVFMNIAMPVMSGLDCCRQFGSDPELRGIPLVLIGDSDCPTLKNEALAAGCAAFLTKPLDRRQFLECSQKFLVGIECREDRRDCQIPVVYEWLGREGRGLCVDISSGGMFLKTDPQAGNGDLLLLHLRLPDRERTVVSLSARVAWVNPSQTPIKPEYPQGYGLEFIEIAEATGIHLRRCFGV